MSETKRNQKNTAAKRWRSKKTITAQNYKRKKEDFLGLNLGTAQNRLRRILMFQLLEETGKHLCYRCNEPMTVDDYSVEHKEPWLWVDKELFWDLKNISFSHIKCNASAARQPNKVDTPEGTYRCCVCKRTLDGEKFPPRKQRPDLTETKRRNIPCIRCHSDQVSAWREKQVKEGLSNR